MPGPGIEPGGDGVCREQGEQHRERGCLTPHQGGVSSDGVSVFRLASDYATGRDPQPRAIRDRSDLLLYYPQDAQTHR